MKFVLGVSVTLFLLMGFLLRGHQLQNQGDLTEVVSSTGVDAETAALLIVRLEDGSRWASGLFRLEIAYSPASTAKIPHTLIALEEGYVDGPDAHFEWDGQERFLEAWNQDHTLSSAFHNSVVWVYQNITRGLGCQTMSSWIDRLSYGNRTIGSPEEIGTYWLNGPLMISIHGQIQFLSRLAMHQLPLSAVTYHHGRQVMLEESGEGWELYGKTGLSGGIGWYVGWLETVQSGFLQTYVFAFNMDVGSWDELPLRKKVVWAALRELGAVVE